MSIVTAIRGGLGNQLFQYAAGRALALRRNTDLAVDLSWYDNRAFPYWRPYELGSFHVQTVPLKGTFRTVYESANEKVRPFLPDVLDAPDGTRLLGYWVDERYFADQAATIRADLSLSTKPIDGVSLHVRRGSSDIPGDFHVLPVSYYREAVERFPDAALYVFSDDIGWCRRNLKLGRPCDFVEGGSAVEDLRLMSSCRHHIIANSTFSWWAAWLNPDPGKIVVRPPAEYAR